MFAASMRSPIRAWVGWNLISPPCSLGTLTSEARTLDHVRVRKQLAAMMIVIGTCTAIAIRFELGERAEVAWEVLTWSWRDLRLRDSTVPIGDCCRALLESIGSLDWTNAAVRFRGPFEEVYTVPGVGLTFGGHAPA